MSLLTISGLDASLGGRPVLHDISFRVAPGEFIGLIGPNGAGKSTLLRALTGLIPFKGDVQLDGQNSRALSSVEHALKAAYVAQERDIAWAMPVADVVMLGRAPHLPRFAPPGTEDRAKVEDAIARMDIAAFRDRPATELSGGELARVLIARALAQDTPLLLADEPTAGLDPAHQIGLMEIFAGLATQGRSVIASTHDLGLAARWCTRLVLLHHGRMVDDGTPASVLKPERLRAIYGVETHIGEASGGMIVQPVSLSTR